MKVSNIFKTKSYFLLYIAFFITMVFLIFLYFITNDIMYFTLILCSLGVFLYINEYIANNFDCLNPDGLFYGIWLFTIGLSQLQLSNSQSSWNAEMWFVVFVSIVSYSLGSKSIGIYGKIIKINNVSSMDRRLVLKNNLAKEKMRTALIISYILSFIAYFIEVIDAGYIPIFGNNMSDYANFGMSYVHYLVVSLGIILVLTFLYFIIYEKDKYLGILFIIGLLILISMLNRHVIIFTAIGIVMSINFFKKRLKLESILLFVFFALIIFTILGSFRNVTPEFLMNYFGYEEKHNLVFMWAYYYLTVGFSNLQNIINLKPPFSYGIQTFTPLWTFTGFKKLFVESMHPNFSGVGTFLEGYYLDFGLIGIIVLPFLLGVFCKYIYLRINTKSIGIVNFTIYLTIVNQLIFSFFTDYFSYTHIPLQIIVAAIIYIFSYYKSENIK